MIHWFDGIEGPAGKQKTETASATRATGFRVNQDFPSGDIEDIRGMTGANCSPDIISKIIYKTSPCCEKIDKYFKNKQIRSFYLQLLISPSGQNCCRW